MSDMHDQPAQQPRGTPAAAGTAAGTAAGAETAAAPGTGQAGGAHRYVPRPAPGYDDVTRDRGPRGAVIGLTMMASVFLMISGLFGFFEGLAAIIRGSFFVVLPNYVYSLSATGWGWVQLITGVVAFATGAALMWDKFWARILGSVIAGLSAVVNFVFLPYYPVWAIIIIAVDVLVIWALLTPRHR